MNTSEKSLFEIMSNFEDVEFELERVRDLLSIFEERMTMDVERLDERWQAEHFKKRYQVSKSLLDTLCIQLTTAIRSMSETIQAGYRISRSIKAAALTK